MDKKHRCHPARFGLLGSDNCLGFVLLRLLPRGPFLPFGVAKLPYDIFLCQRWTRSTAVLKRGFGSGVARLGCGTSAPFAVGLCSLEQKFCKIKAVQKSAKSIRNLFVFGTIFAKSKGGLFGDQKCEKIVFWSPAALPNRLGCAVARLPYGTFAPFGVITYPAPPV